MDTRERSDDLIGSSVDSEEKDDETKLVPPDTEETNQKNGEKMPSATTEEGSSVSTVLSADSEKMTEELSVDEEQIPSRTPVQSMDTIKNTCETIVQSRDSVEKSGVTVGSSVDGEEGPTIIEGIGAIEEVPNVLDSDAKEKSDISKPFHKAVEEIQSETFPPSADAENKKCGTTVPSADTEEVHGKTNVMSVNPGEEPGLLPIPSEDSKKEADTKLELRMEEEILGKTSEQTKATEKHACEAIVETGGSGERGDVSESFVDGAKEPPVLPVIDVKPGETTMDSDSDFQEEPDIRKKPAVETEEKSVLSADTQERLVGISAQAVDVGEDSDVSPINEEMFGEATNEKPSFRNGSEVDTEEMPSETLAQCANVENLTCEANLHSANTEYHGEASVQPVKKAVEPGVLPVFSTDTRKNIDTRAGGVTSVEDLVQSGQQSPRTSVDTLLPEQSQFPKEMDQRIDSPKDINVSNPIRQRKFPFASQYKPLDSLYPASDEEDRSNRSTIYPVVAGLLMLVAGILVYLLCGSRSSVPPSSSVLQIFQEEFKSLRNYFPGQNEALWLRSHKMHLKHLNKSQPLEPATIILTAARDGERTLRCLSEGLARTYSLALNASYSVINGSAKAKHESKDIKLQIDMALSSGFTTTSRAAVLHRLEELPPGSVLILYKYCDHENAAYKNVALVFTVLLEVATLDLNLPLRDLEEKVKDVLWDRFLHTNRISSHDEMDVDKLSGVWSRISHLVLPVVPVDSIESGSCPWGMVKQ